MLSPPGPLLPEDAVIGPLQDWKGVDESTKAALAAAKAFLDGIVAGKIIDASVSPDRSAIVGTFAGPLLEAPHPVAWRIGILAFSGEGADLGALAPIRLAWPAGDAKPGSLDFSRHGEIGLRSLDGLWYVESISLAPAGKDDGQRKPPASSP